MPSVLSIQSSVAYGHVGNSAAVFPLQRQGIDVWPVHTVQFSNHTGYGAWRGYVVEVDQVRAIIEGVAERGAFATCDAVLSGYLGDARLGDAVLDTVARLREERGRMLYACDPVMGDIDRGFFVREGIPDFFRERAVPEADLVTPNQFELAYLTDSEITDLDAALAAAHVLRRRGPETVYVTSLEVAGAKDSLAVLGVNGEGAWLVRTPRLPVNLNGTGDAITAMLLAQHLQGRALAEALSRAVSAMFALVEATHEADSRELRLVAAQERWLEPARLFAADKVG